MTAKRTSDKGIDELFDEGQDMTPFIVDEEARFPAFDDTPRKINISMPEWMIEELDATARHHATTRQGVINMWVGERLRAQRTA